MLLKIRDREYVIPDVLRVGAHDYSVMDGFVFRERDDLCGQADHLQGEIRIRKIDRGGVDLSDTVRLAVLLHEVLHAVDYVFNNSELTDGDEGERHIDVMAQGMAQVLLDNGLLAGRLNREV